MKIIHILLLAISLIGVVFISGCAKYAQTATPTNQQAGPVQCTDSSCFQPQFLACNPSELKIPFAEGITYVITVFGIADGKCHYAFKLVDNDGKAISGMQVTDCNVPKEKITQDTFGHFFGQDKLPGKESIKVEQDKIEADYCTKQ